MKIRKRDVRKRTKQARSSKVAAERKRTVTKLLGDIIGTIAEEIDRIISTRASRTVRLSPTVAPAGSPQPSTSSGIFHPRISPIPCSTGSYLSSPSTNIDENSKGGSGENYSFFDDENLLAEMKSIEYHSLEIEYNKDEKTLLGCRIVNIDYFLKKSMSLQINHNKKCTGGSLEITREKREGLKCTFILKCNVCDKEVEICNEEPTTDNKSILNKAAVWATISTGSTYIHMAEFFSILDIPCLSRNSFFTIQRELGQIWQNSLWKNMEEAGKEEYSAAMKRGDIDCEGIPYIPVYVDGGWSKRSYGHTYNAYSGVAVIIGKHSGKLLFVGVRNKYCSICSRAKNKNEEPKNHTCFKNWTGSSSSMEQDIVVEGFNCSIQMHNVKYKKFVADGDSSVYARIKEKVAYGREVEKVECMNHVLKNYGKSLYKIQKDTKGVPLAARKLLTRETLDELTKSVQTAIYANYQDVDNLKLEIRNTLYHVFGNHLSCSPYLCSNIGHTADDKTEELRTSGLHHHIYGAMSQLLTKTHLLIDKETNNRAELFMSILVRFNIGKRLNLIQRDSFQTRAYLTGLRYNEGFNWHIEPWKEAFRTSPAHHLKEFIDKEKKNIEKKKEKPIQKRKPAKRLKSAEFQHLSDYGPNIAEVTLPPEALKIEIEHLYNRLQVTKEQRDIIYKETVGQFENPKYLTERMNRLTASNFGAVVKRKDYTSCDVLVKHILNIYSLSTAGIAYGKANETVAVSMYEEELKRKIYPSGLIIHLKSGFLAASPDGIIDDDEIVEVKCSLKVASSGLSLEEAVKKKLVSFLTIADGNIVIKKGHDYYYQVQGQLEIAEAKVCHFIVYTGPRNPLLVQLIHRDETFFQEIMWPKLERFYKTCIAPEIILNRRSKNLKCIDPPFIQNAQEMREKNKK